MQYYTRAEVYADAARKNKSAEFFCTYRRNMHTSIHSLLFLLEFMKLKEENETFVIAQFFFVSSLLNV